MAKGSLLICMAMLTITSLSSCGSIDKAQESTTTEIPATITATEIPTTILATEPEPTTEETSALPEAVTEPTTEPDKEQFPVNISPSPDEELPEKYVIKGFKTVMQDPELPTGCEVTALCQVLNHLGFKINKTELFDNFMAVDYIGAVTMNQAYIGDPRSKTGFGCNAPVTVKTAYEYFQSIDSPCCAVDITGTDFRELFSWIAQDIPVIVWTTMGLQYGTEEYMWTAGNGEKFYFNNLQHCVAIYGYDLKNDKVYTADPQKGNVEYSIKQFEKMYDIMKKQAVVIYGNSKTEGHFSPDPEIENNDVWSRKKQIEEADKKKKENTETQNTKATKSKGSKK